MTLIFLAVAACIFWGVKYRREGCDDAYLSVEKGKPFRTILALTVACHHLAEETGDSSPFHIFAFLGFLPVAYFFFLSGYGLQKSYACKPGYRASILKKRIPSVLMPYLAVTALYWLLSAVEGDAYSVREVLRGFATGDPIARFTWYIQFVLILYLGFYLVTALYRGDQLRGAVLHALYLGLCTGLFQKWGFGFHWINSCITYPLGILWAMKEEQWLPFVRRHYRLLTAVALPAFGLAFLGAMALVDRPWVLALYWPSAVLFTAVCLLLQMKLTFGNRFLITLGDCSMEIYMLHGLFMNLYRGNRIYMNDPVLWSGAVLISTCLAAWVFHRLFSRKKTRIPA